MKHSWTFMFGIVACSATVGHASQTCGKGACHSKNEACSAETSGLITKKDTPSRVSATAPNASKRSSTAPKAKVADAYSNDDEDSEDSDTDSDDSENGYEDSDS